MMGGGTRLLGIGGAWGRRKRYIAGHTGLVGSALLRRWAGDAQAQTLVAARAGLDLTDGPAVEAWLSRAKPDEVIIAAGRVGGIAANASAPAQFLYDNLMIEANLIHGAWAAGVERLLNFGSSCMYPKRCPQPMRPEHLMSGAMEPTSEPYAMAKGAGLSLCASMNRQYGTRYITAIPCTLYGPGDNFNAAEAHVLAALVRKFHEAKARGERVRLWGSGQARREFLYVDDMAEACDFLLQTYAGDEPVNIGSGESCAIRDLAELVADVVGFHGEIDWDASQPDGAPEKRLDSSVMRGLGWSPRTDLRTGLERTSHWFLKHEEQRCVSS